MSMQGKTVAITGATSGIGEAAALALASQGARIVFTARDEARGAALLAGLESKNAGAGHQTVSAELTTLAGMREAGEALAAAAPSIDVLANNAGAVFTQRELTADGLEKTFAVNHMAYFVVTERLRANMAPGGRIVSTASAAHVGARVDFDDLAMLRRYSTFSAYGRSKLCNILWTRELGRRLQGSGVTASCFHPGGVATRLGSNNSGLLSTLFRLAGRFMLTPEQGADTLVWLASSPEAPDQNGCYFARRKRVTPSPAALDDAAAARLWQVSEEIAARVSPA